MKVKYSIVLALSHHARLFIFDEPTSGLDPVARDELLELFHSLVQEGTRSILFSTHITSDLDKCADDITYIQSGNILLSAEKINSSRLSKIYELKKIKQNCHLRKSCYVQKGEIDMMRLLYKEFRLSAHPTLYIFIFMGALILIPEYPYCMVFFLAVLLRSLHFTMAEKTTTHFTQLHYP